jgi:hypothetical protein
MVQNGVGRRNPIYLFFEDVAGNPDGSSEEGVKYWKCWLGNRKVLKVTRAMNYSINGMCSLLLLSLQHFDGIFHTNL